MQKRWIWPFELMEKIGEGGMGVVYRARYVGNDRIVAVKLLPSEVVNNPTISARFERELEVLKTLKHPHIVHSFGGVCEDEQRFYAMELIEGGSLEILLRKRGRLSWEQCIEYSLQICSALTCAHEQGVVHRDLKPPNLLITNDGRLKLTDFGLAHVTAGTKLTAAGKTMGTFLYMAPEQIRGKPAPSPRTDLYALGCVIYEMLTGRVPFNGDTPAEVLNAHLKEQAPRVSTLALDCPAPLDQLVTELLAKDPQQRPSDAETVASRLRHIMQTCLVTVHGQSWESEGRPTVAAAPIKSSPQSRTERNWLLGACAGLLVVMVVWNLSLLREDPAARRARNMWVEALHHRDATVRNVAAHALGELGTPSDPLVQELVQGLSDDDDQVREAIIRALSQFGAEAKSAIPALMSVQRDDSSPNVRSEAALALERIRKSESRRSLWSSVGFYLGGFLFVVLIVLGGMKAREFLPTR